MRIANTRHGRSCRYNVTEVVEHTENLVLAHGIGVLAFNAEKFIGNAVVHVLG